MASPPAWRINSTVSVLPSWPRLATTSFAPARPMAMAVARPIPELAPVTNATFPSSCFIRYSLKMATAAAPS
jgi:hypothetical protein